MDIEPDRAPYQRLAGWVRGAGSADPESPQGAAGPAADGAATALAAGSLLTWAVTLTMWAVADDAVVSALGTAAWYLAGAAIVLVVWRRWGGAWAILVPWVAPLLYENLTSLLAPLFNGVWSDGHLFPGAGDAPFSIKYVIGVGAGAALLVAIWRQSLAWRSKMRLDEDLVDDDARRAVLLGAPFLFVGYTLLVAFSAAGSFRAIANASAVAVTLLLALVFMAYHAEAAPRAAVWVFAIAGAYLAAESISAVVELAAFFQTPPESGAIWALVTLSGIVAVAQGAWAAFVLIAALAQHSLTSDGVVATVSGDGAADATALVTPADDEGKSLPQSS